MTTAASGTALTPPPPAGRPVVDASWSATGTTLGEVEAELERMRSKGEHLATRASVVNLVVVAPDAENAERTASAMSRLGGRHPGRTVVVCTVPGSPTGLDAEISLSYAQAEGHVAWWDEVRLTAGGALADHLDALVEPLLLGHLPVAAWYPGPLPARGDPLADRADAVLVDSRFAEPLGLAPEVAEDRRMAFASLVDLARKHPVVDLSWKRLTPWRELLAGLFDPVDQRPFVTGVTNARIAAQPGPRRLLAGWLVSRLGLRDDQVTLQDALHATVELRCTHGGRAARFVVERTHDDPIVSAFAEVEGEVVRAQRQLLPEHGLTWSLAQGLSHLDRDPVYEHAIHAALGFADAH